MKPLDGTDSRPLRALTKLVRRSTKPPSDAELERGLGALLNRTELARPRARSHVGPLAFIGAVGLCSAIAALVSVFLLTDRGLEPPIAVSRIEGGELREGGYLSGSDEDGVKLRFNEGSEFTLLPGARGRLRTLDATGAHLALERGSASVRITPAPERNWSVEAGPFSVRVTGTEFDLSWDPTTERLEVALRRGRVVVSGPVVGEDLGLRAGQKLSVSLPRAETIITELRVPDGVVAPSATSAVTESSSPSSVSSSSVSSSPSVEPPPRLATTTPAPPRSGERRWHEAMAKGEWDRILRDVDRDGVAETLATVSSEELLILANAARYRRRGDLAHEALLAQRRRFPDSPRSVEALFLLGRVEESRGRDAASAIRWYDEYLERTPTGTYAAEALGRKMILLQTRKPLAAKVVAEDYLRRFPNSTYAGTARALLRSAEQ